MVIKKFKIVLMIFLIIFLGVIIGGYYYVQTNLQSVIIEDRVEIDIPRGSSINTIAEVLKSENLIHNPFVFEMYTRYKGVAGSFRAGTYEFEGEVTPENIVERLKKGDVVDESIRFTIPEGLRGDQVAKRLENNGLGEKDRYLELFNSLEKFDYWFLEDIDTDNSVKYMLEGFLYPETYSVENDITEKEVVKMLLDQFDKVFDDDFRVKKEELGMDIKDLITIASIVEREAVVDDERAKVAGVFYNRLEDGIKLEACATVEYVLRENKPRLTIEDTKIESDYNTYMHAGLPPGPIASPGKKSIKAALNPEEHDYYYFVAKEDGSREHYFSETLEEHNRARRRARID